MPAEHPAPHTQHQQDLPPPQIKVCSSCHRSLSGDSATAPPFLLHDGEDASDTSIVCPPCRTRILAARTEAPPVSVARGEVLFAQVERELRRRAASLQTGDNEADALHTPVDSVIPFPADAHAEQQEQHTSRHDDDVDMDSPIATRPQPIPNASGSLARPSFVEGSSFDSLPTRKALTVVVNHGAACNQGQAPASAGKLSHSPLSASHWASSRDRPLPTQHSPTHPDPLVDITRLRVRSQGHHCLYPGAIFQGTQKSGRNSYDVSVTIVDVDFSLSHLCGYLRIRGLTDDWPELTTYFDAEIIGSRHGFLTRNWGATEQEDMVHWGRFPAFRHVRNELKKPHLTMKDADRGAVFMRWKERFLVPDHRVQDISGASFAGFYYVCVDFNPQPTHSALDSPLSPTLEDLPEVASPMHSSLPKPEVTSPRLRRESTNRGSRRLMRSPSSSRTAHTPVATMSGFYFHQHSEPYQQLSLVHVPEHTSSSFEFR
ncbi:vacuolar import and degradation protein-domain-containing protein [Phanerochaete sordida]|uniref:Vacuolar import and degradation protein-domain-containing protein n=1 Tax=Phanerochaete sordida TaxID=48140 RepID=A0A9P3GHR1_9APHY|nr:vacuolar import and degradation protein-domain-containing protein [Phanerochaete sordida]